MQSENAQSSGQGPRTSGKSSSIFRKKATRPTASEQPSRPEPSASSTSACRLETFEKITVRKFIDCYLTGDRTILIIEGAANAEALEDAWLTIYSGYCSAVGNTNLSGLISRTKQARILRSRVTRVAMAIDLARFVAADEVAEVFREYGFSFDPTLPPEEYHAQLDAIAGRLHPDIGRLQALEVLPELDGREPTEQDFRDVLFEIGKFQGYEARDSMLLIDYCTAIRKRQEHIHNEAKKPRYPWHDRSYKY